MPRQRNLVKGRIAALSPLAAENGFVRDLDRILESLDPHISARKRHLDQLSRFCTAHPCTRHTETHTRRHTDICRNRHAAESL